ncbi:MAG: DMT family transporter, partial [Actinomycetota bacterium]
MAWVLLVFAIGAEVFATLSLKASDGFSRLWPSLGVVAGYTVAFT